LSRVRQLKEWLAKNRTQYAPVKDEGTEAYEQYMAQTIFYIEMKCKQNIKKDYPLMKFYSLMENMSAHYDKLKEKSNG
jgi:hypothetical protein